MALIIIGNEHKERARGKLPQQNPHGQENSAKVVEKVQN